MTPPVTRVRLAPTSGAALLTCAALMLVAASPASALSRHQAEKKALASMGSKQVKGSVVVFGLKKSLRPGTRVTQTRADGSKKVLLRVRSERAFFFYEDSTPSSLYRHRGRVALVGAKSGRIRMSMVGTPLFTSGKLPVQVGSSNAAASIYRVYYKNSANVDAEPSSQEAASSTTSGSTESLTHPNSPPKADRQELRAKQNSPKHITITGSDDDGDMLQFAITRQPNHGTISGAPPDLTYTPDPGYLGRDFFLFKSYDEIAQSNTAKVGINVVPLGSPPVVTTSAGCTAYTEQTPAVVVDSLVGVTDPDDTTLDSATVRVSVNFQDGDEFLFTDQNGITGSYDDLTDVLHLTGTASVADYQTALQSVRYRNLSNGNPTTTKDVEFTVNDAGNDSAPATKQLCIAQTGPNDKPTVETSEGSLSYLENDGPLPLDGIVSVLDVDSAQLSGASVKFTASQPSEEEEVDPGAPGSVTTTYQPGEDSLGFVNQNGITGSYNSTTGALTLSGPASVEDYQTALQSVTYENSSENPSEEPRIVRFQVTDSSGANSAPSSRQIFVSRVNDAPVVTTTDGAGGYTEGDPATAIDSGLTVGDVDDTNIEGGQVSISDGFEPGDELVYVNQNGINGAYNTVTGELTLTGSASVADYQAAVRSIEFRGTSDNPPITKTILYGVSDGELDSPPATRTISVTGVNDKPVLVASAGSQSFTEGGAPVAVDTGISASDVDSATFTGATAQISAGLTPGDVLAVATQNGISGAYNSGTGVLTLTGAASVADYETALRSITYENGSDDPTAATRTVTFQVDDGGATSNLSDPVSRDVAVTPVNDAPVVTTSAGSTGYVEGDPATEVDTGATVADADDADIESAVVKISSGFEAGDDLAFADQNGITGVYVGGELTLTGSSSVANYEAALRSVKFGHSGDPVTSASRTVDFTVNDGDADSNTASKTIDISPPPNDAPVVITSGGSTPYAEGDPATDLDSELVVTDADDTDLESAVVKISSGFEAGDDLAFVDQNGITGVYVGGELTLTGSSSVANYEAALRSIQFGHSGDPVVGTSRTVDITVNDGDDDSNTASKTVDITPLP
jgi:hypothetical protein